MTLGLASSQAAFEPSPELLLPQQPMLLSPAAEAAGPSLSGAAASIRAAGLRRGGPWRSSSSGGPAPAEALAATSASVVASAAGFESGSPLQAGAKVQRK